ncbi:hypothetical protein KAR91_84425 [Candidatus Pacearchaeota archaeon]|nr:hypothetical protein [Candidatus Pacearchaeota archaeon]
MSLIDQYQKNLETLQANNPEMTLPQIIEMINKSTERLGKEVARVLTLYFTKADKLAYDLNFLVYLQQIQDKGEMK